MSAIRLARGFTGRDLIVKFAGCYHGHADSLLVEAGSGLATFGTRQQRRRARAAFASTRRAAPGRRARRWRRSSPSTATRWRR